jgi:hypothetical protein
MSERSDRPCQAADPATCRFHQGGVFADSAVAMYFQELSSPYSFSGDTHFQTAVANRDAVSRYAHDVVAHVEAGIADKSIDATDKKRFLQQINRLSQDVELEILRDGAISGEHYSQMVFSRLNKPIAEQFNRRQAFVPPADNALDPDSGASPFDRSAASFLLAKGDWVEQYKDTFYGGWRDYDARAHVDACGVQYVGTAEEDSWDSFAGTFADDPFDTDHGLTADAACNCGAVRSKLRIEGSFSNLARSVANWGLR